MHRFDDPDITLDGLKNFKLEPFTHLVQSLRGFACNASLLVAGYQYYIASEYALTEKAKEMSDEEYAAEYYFFHAFQSDILVRLRKSCEPDKKSLASGAITDLLSNSYNINLLRNYVSKRETIASADFHKYVEYIRVYCGVLSTPTQIITDQSTALLRKIALVRRMTNKAVAHITLDDYKVDSSDIHDVFIAVSTVACAIQSVMGDLSCPTKLELAESMAFEISSRNTPSGYLKKFIPLIQLFLPEWVEENLTSSSSGRINALLS
jgi:hypothetical protein